MRSMIFVALVAVFLSPIVFAQEKWEAPVWKVGDKWVFKMANGQIQNNEVVEIEKDVYILRIGEKYFHGFDKNTMNIKFDDSSGKKTLSTRVTAIGVRSIMFDFG